MTEQFNSRGITLDQVGKSMFAKAKVCAQRNTRLLQGPKTTVKGEMGVVVVYLIIF